MKNLISKRGFLNPAFRENRLGHKSLCIWLTGLSASGKSSIAYELERILFESGYLSYVLDGDNIRQGLNKDLGFSNDDRKENIRRTGETARLFVEAGFIIITSFISPFKLDRDFVRKLFPAEKFIEVYIKCSIEDCIERDPKGLYKMALKGELEEFTDISSPYEEPDNPELIIENSSGSDIVKNSKRIYKYLIENKLI